MVFKSIRGRLVAALATWAFSVFAYVSPKIHPAHIPRWAIALFRLGAYPVTAPDSAGNGPRPVRAGCRLALGF
jgi:hypothetical protein